MIEVEIKKGGPGMMRIDARPYGYLTNTGYLGMIPNGQMVLFPTEQEYLDTIMEENDVSDS